MVTESRQPACNLFFNNHLLQVFQDLPAFCQNQTGRLQPQRAVKGVEVVGPTIGEGA